MNLTLLYRGPLSSCNYGCPYCPFAKRKESRADHARDAAALERFITWAEGYSHATLSIFFTPWGEALIRRRYQQAFVRLSALPHLRRVAIQTNLSCRLDWVEDCDKAKIALWATYHPGEADLRRFLAQCEKLTVAGVRYSVGVVGLKAHLSAIETLRAALPTEVYLWVNAYKREPDYYDPATLATLTALDPLFPINNTYHPSQGRACRTGEEVISVDGDGTVRRCHFVKTPIGNLYDPNFEACLRPRPCPNATCGCHIGYIHMPHLGLYEVFGEGILERANSNWQMAAAGAVRSLPLGIEHDSRL